MLNGWNSRVRITSAMSSACTTTRTVSASPPSLRFPSVDTLIGLSLCVVVAGNATGAIRSTHDGSGGCAERSVTGRARIRPIACRFVKGGPRRLRLASGIVLQRKPDQEHQGAARRNVPPSDAPRRPWPMRQSHPVACQRCSRAPSARRPDRRRYSRARAASRRPTAIVRRAGPMRHAAQASAPIVATGSVRRSCEGSAARPRSPPAPARAQAPALMRSAYRHGEAAGRDVPPPASANSSKPCSLKRMSKG